MTDFLASALSDAKADFESRKSSGGARNSAKRIKVGPAGKKDDKWLKNHKSSQKGQRTVSTGPEGLSDYDLQRSKKALEAKAREYKRMFNKGTDMGLTGEAADNLMVDFDRKWAEGHRQEEDSDQEGLVNEDEDPLIEIEDEFGRTRQIRKSDALRHERPVIENERPQNLIHGPHLQAFKPDASKKDAIWAEENASKEVHYDPNFELRQRGTGYINLGRGDDRKDRMTNLKRSRENTLRTRGEDFDDPEVNRTSPGDATPHDVDCHMNPERFAHMRGI